MTYQELYKLVRKGKTGMIPNWKGYIKWNYSKNQIYFVNGDYRIDQEELENKIKDRNDLYYII